MPPATYAYGAHRHQVGELTLPPGATAEHPAPVAVLVHGGSWFADVDLSPLRPLAADLAGQGWAAWDVEYRRIGAGSGGGWPQTLHDVSAAVDHLAALAADGVPVDVGRVVAIGHSAGGHLALLDAARDPATAAVRVRGVVGLAPVTDVRDVRSDSVAAFLGGPPESRPAAYAAASPITRLPLGLPQLVLHGDRDAHVPPGTAADYVTAAREAGDDATFDLRPGLDHFEIAGPDPGTRAAIAAFLDAVR